MPKLLVHLWIADQLAARYGDLKDPDFYLGSIAPDAVYSRCADIKRLKKMTHIVSPLKTWEKGVMRSYEAICRPSLFELGYHMHIVTDIRFLEAMRSFYAKNKVPGCERAHYDKLIVPLAIRTLFPGEQAYRDCVAYARKYKTASFPFGITKADIENNFIYADNIFEIKKIIADKADLDIPLPDYKNICLGIMEHLASAFRL